MVRMDVMENDASVMVKHIFSAIKNGVRASEPGSDSYTSVPCCCSATVQGLSRWWCNKQIYFNLL